MKAILIVQELAAADPLYQGKMQATYELTEGLVELLRNDKCLTSSPAKAVTITTIYYIAVEEIRREKLADGGSIAHLLEIVRMADKNVCELVWVCWISFATVARADPLHVTMLRKFYELRTLQQNLLCIFYGQFAVTRTALL